MVAESPAAKAGLSKGLIVQKINGASAKGKTINECIALMKGPIGTKVHLELLDTTTKVSRQFELSKQRFPLAVRNQVKM